MHSGLPKEIQYGLQRDLVVNVCLSTGKVYAFAEMDQLETDIQKGRCIAAVLAVRDPKTKKLFQLDGEDFDLHFEIHMYGLWQAELAKTTVKS